VLNQHHFLQRARKKLHHLVHGVTRAGADVVDDRIVGVYRSIGVPIPFVDRVAVADQKLLDLQSIGDLL
jgi:hypothetical protein